MTTDTTLADLMRGSEAYAVLSRVGGGPPELVDGTKLKLAKSDAGRRLLAALDSPIEQLRAFAQQFDADPDFDQTLAMLRANQMIEDAKAGFAVDPATDILFISGRGGSGKTELISRIVQTATAANLKVLVVAPTNRAIKVVASRCAPSLTEDQRDFVTFSTCHAAFRALCLNEIGGNILANLLEIEKSHREHGTMLPLRRVEVKGASDHVINAVNEVLEEANRDKGRVMRAAHAAAKASMGLLDDPAALIAAVQRLGFDSLDARITHWANRAAEASIVVVDEIGMVGRAMLRSALELGARVICAGDTAQLEPVSLVHVDAQGREWSDAPALSMATAGSTVHLVRSRRIDDGNKIGDIADLAMSSSFNDFSMRLRQYCDELPYVNAVTNISTVPVEDLRDGLVLTYTNERRHGFNASVRRQLGFRENQIEKGDKLVVSLLTSSARDLGIVKDELLTFVGPCDNPTPARQWTVRRESGDMCDIEALAFFDPRGRDEEVKYIQKAAEGSGFCFYEASYEAGQHELVVTIGHALTIHKSQGSEAPVVTLDLRSIRANKRLLEDFDQTIGFGGVRWNSWRRLAYTAISRSRGRLNVIF